MTLVSCIVITARILSKQVYGTATDQRCIIGFKRKCRSHPVTYVTPLSFSEPVALIRLRLSCSDIDGLRILERKEACTTKSFNEIRSALIMHYLPTRKQNNSQVIITRKLRCNMDELAKEAFVYKCIMFNYVYVNYLDIDIFFLIFLL